MSEIGGSAVKKMQSSDGVLEYWSTGVLVLSSKKMYVNSYLMEFLSFYPVVFPLLHHSITPER
jgi:hypothetical protein